MGVKKHGLTELEALEAADFADVDDLTPGISRTEDSFDVLTAGIRKGLSPSIFGKNDDITGIVLKVNDASALPYGAGLGVLAASHLLNQFGMSTTNMATCRVKVYNSKHTRLYDAPDSLTIPDIGPASTPDEINGALTQKQLIDAHPIFYYNPLQYPLVPGSLITGKFHTGTYQSGRITGFAPESDLAMSFAPGGSLTPLSALDFSSGVVGEASGENGCVRPGNPPFSPEGLAGGPMIGKIGDVKVNALMKNAWEWLRPHLPAGAVLTGGIRTQKEQDNAIIWLWKHKAKLPIPAGIPENDCEFLTRAQAELTKRGYFVARWVGGYGSPTRGHGTGEAIDISSPKLANGANLYPMKAIVERISADPRIPVVFAPFRGSSKDNASILEIKNNALHLGIMEAVAVTAPTLGQPSFPVLPDDDTSDS